MSTKGMQIHRARGYDAFTAVLFLGRERAVRRRLLAGAALQPGERVLDLGCGTGSFTLPAAEIAGPGRVVGVDLSESMIERARRRAAARGAGIRYDVASADDLPFTPGSFDVVISCLALHHLPADVQQGAFHEIARVLTPSGRIHLADFDLEHAPRLHRIVARLQARHHGHAGQHDHGHGASPADGRDDVGSVALPAAVSRARAAGLVDVTIDDAGVRHFRVMHGHR